MDFPNCIEGWYTGMKKWVLFTLALVLLLPPVSASAMDVPLDPANRPRHGYKLLVPEPDIDGLDLSRLTDDELNDLDARVDAETTPAPPRRPRRPRSPRVSGSGTK